MARRNAIGIERRIWFLDETGVDLSFSREYARSFRGIRALGNKPKNYGDSAGLLRAINENGTIAALEVRGATDETVILAFIEEILAEFSRRPVYQKQLVKH